MLGLTIIAPADRDTLSNFSITVASPPNRDDVIVRYAGIKGNKPGDYDNTVALWDTLLPDPVLDQPLTTARITSNQQPGEVIIKWEFQATDYLVTYQSGKALTTMCASLELSPRMRAEAVPPNNVILDITCITATSVTVRYGTLAGYRPLTFQNWAGSLQRRADGQGPDQGQRTARQMHHRRGAAYDRFNILGRLFHVIERGWPNRAGGQCDVRYLTP